MCSEKSQPLSNDKGGRESWTWAVCAFQNMTLVLQRTSEGQGYMKELKVHVPAEKCQHVCVSPAFTSGATISMPMPEASHSLTYNNQNFNLQDLPGKCIYSSKADLGTGAFLSLSTFSLYSFFF